MRLRGFSPGAQPKGVIDVEHDQSGKYYCILVYDRPLTEKELNNYELDYIESNFQKRRRSLCLSCNRFWKTQTNANEKCYRGGSDGGLIDYCTGYEERKS